MLSPSTTRMLVASVALLVVGCAYQAPLATIPSRQIDTQKISFGSAQQLKSKVDQGASVGGGDVVQALGSPNIVSTNPDGTETWVYDKIITEKEMAAGQNTSVQTQSSRTMMILIKFNKKNAVESIVYRQTSY